MTEIRLTNSKTHRKEAFRPLDPANVRVYLCGPTVYDRAHLGNARPVVVFDVLYRLLRHVYGPDHVTYVRNFTDVDDKIIARAAETGRDIGEITEETIGWYHDDMDALGALRPTHEPRATEYIEQMVKMIEALIARGHAYATEGNVLFDVRSYPEYGALSGRSVDDMIAGARVEVAPYKRDPMDFVLWKPSSDDLPGWDSPWGRGRPGWHIECSAMSDDLLWKKPLQEGRLSEEALKHPHAFDIHAGGIDLQFPHHENEIAQSCCAHKGGEGEYGEFAQVWMHNEMLQVEGKKMSKSLGNFFTVRDLLAKGVPGEVIRFVLLGTHYSKPMDWTERKAEEDEALLRRWLRAASNAKHATISEDLVATLANDLNTSGAREVINRQFQALDLAGLRGSLEFLGLMQDGRLPQWAEEVWQAFEGLSISSRPKDRDSVPTILRILERWNEHRLRKEFRLADELKAAALDAGLELRVTQGFSQADTTSHRLDPAKLEALK